MSARFLAFGGRFLGDQVENVGGSSWPKVLQASNAAGTMQMTPGNTDPTTLIMASAASKGFWPRPFASLMRIKYLRYGKISRDELLDMVDSRWKPLYENTCGIRMSKALNDCGMMITPKARVGKINRTEIFSSFETILHHRRDANARISPKSMGRTRNQPQHAKRYAIQSHGLR